MMLVTDSESADDARPYPTGQGVTAAASSLVWMQLGVDKIIENAEQSADGGTGVWPVTVEVHVGWLPAHLNHMWSGRLWLPSGVVLFAEWSMQPLGRLIVPAGDYLVNIAIDDVSHPSRLGMGFIADR